MKIEILDEAQEDLIQGFHFYESREPGLGSYFIDCLFSDVDSLLVCAGIHQIVHAYHRYLSKRFPSQFITAWRETWFACVPCSIVAGIHRGSEND